MTNLPTIDDLIAVNRLVGGPGRVINLTHLQSALARPVHTFDGHLLHTTVITQAGALLEGLVAAHGFEDGNKRTAWITAKTFLISNNIPTGTVDSHHAADFVEGIATHTYAGPAVARWLADNLTTA